LYFVFSSRRRRWISYLGVITPAMCDLGAASIYLFYNTKAAKVARSPCYGASAARAARFKLKSLLIVPRRPLFFSSKAALLLSFPAAAVFAL